MLTVATEAQHPSKGAGVAVDDEFLTTAEVAELLKLHEKTVLRLAGSGEIPGRKFGREWRFRLADIHEVFDQARDGGGGDDA